MSIDEDTLLQTGLDAISKAFTIKKSNSKEIIKEQFMLIIDLKSKVTSLKNRNHKYAADISFLQMENQQLKKQNEKMRSILNENHLKMNQIKSSIINSTKQQPQPIPQPKSKQEKGVKLTLNNVKNGLSNQLFKKKRPMIEIGSKHNEGFISHRSHYSESFTDEKQDSSQLLSRFNRNLTLRENGAEEHHSCRQTMRNRKEEPYAIKPSSSCRYRKADTWIDKETPYWNQCEAGKSKKTTLYKRKNDFLNECNLRLTSRNFETILSLFEKLNLNEIGFNEGISHIRNCLQNDSVLLKLLGSLHNL